jgi:hypothetical protein
LTYLMIFKFGEETVSANCLFTDGNIDLAAKGYSKDLSVF